MSKNEGLSHQDWETYYVHCKMSKPSNVKQTNNSIKKTNYVNKEIKWINKLKKVK